MDAQVERLDWSDGEEEYIEISGEASSLVKIIWHGDLESADESTDAVALVKGN